MAKSSQWLLQEWREEMFLPERSSDVDELLLNARLRDELEPLFDESIGRMNARQMTTYRENEFLASMLEWERAPILPISRWFNPEMVLPHPDHLDEAERRVVLRLAIDQLFEKHIVLDFTDHLSDYQLYCLIYRDILPSHEKLLARRCNYLHWDCANVSDDPTIWLRYYASEEERQMWLEESDEALPPHEDPPYRRELPKAPM